MHLQCWVHDIINFLQYNFTKKAKRNKPPIKKSSLFYSLNLKQFHSPWINLQLLHFKLTALKKEVTQKWREISLCNVLPGCIVKWITVTLLKCKHMFRWTYQLKVCYFAAHSRHPFKTAFTTQLLPWSRIILHWWAQFCTVGNPFSTIA